MVNNNAKSVIKQVLAAGDTIGLLPVTDVGGTTRYVADFSAYPAVVEDTFTLTAADAGISVGSGTTAAAATDYQLESTITSGLTGTVVIVNSVDGNGNASITFQVTLENTSGSSISISEIGYKQEIAAADTAEGTTATDRVFLLDRSVFQTITLADGEQAAIDYTLKSAISNSGGVVGTKSITANGTYAALDDSLDGYSTVTVNVPSSAVLGTKNITQNGTYNASSDNFDGYSQVTVNVSGGGSASLPFIRPMRMNLVGTVGSAIANDNLGGNYAMYVPLRSDGSYIDPIGSNPTAVRIVCRFKVSTPSTSGIFQLCSATSGWDSLPYLQVYNDGTLWIAFFTAANVYQNSNISSDMVVTADKWYYAVAEWYNNTVYLKIYDGDTQTLLESKSLLVGTSMFVRANSVLEFGGEQNSSSNYNAGVAKGGEIDIANTYVKVGNDIEFGSDANNMEAVLNS